MKLPTMLWVLYVESDRWFASPFRNFNDTGLQPAVLAFNRISLAKLLSLTVN